MSGMDIDPPSFHSNGNGSAGPEETAGPTPTTGNHGNTSVSQTTALTGSLPNGYSSGSVASMMPTPPIRQTPNAPALLDTYRPPASASAPTNHSQTPFSNSGLAIIPPWRAPTLNTETSAEKRFSSVEKGKGRAPSPPNGTQPHHRAVHRRPQESDNNLRDGDDVIEVMSTKASTTSHVAINPASTVLSQVDKAFAERIEANNLKPILGRDIKGLYPVWSHTRKGLQSALEYMRNPIKTAGGSVDISPGGLARGIILERATPSDLAFWGKGIEGGTLLLPVGRPRVRRKQGQKPEMNTEFFDDPLSTTNDESFITPLPTSNPVTLPKSDSELPTSNRPLESPEIEALLMTHRARIPIAVAVGQDYPHTPFQVPRPFIVLGWFWIIDAWVEPVVTIRNPPGMAQSVDVDQDRVVWKFRFEYQNKASEPPWWQFNTEPNPRPCPTIDSKDSTQAWNLTSDRPSVTYTPAAHQDQMNRGPEDDGADTDYLTRTRSCSKCQGVSSRPYSVHEPMCLDEECAGWSRLGFEIKHWVATFQRDILPGIVRERITPESLGMVLRPPEPEDPEVKANHQGANAGREYWTGWVCHGCGCASERKKWYGWNCEACKRTLYPKHWIYGADKLRGPLRPVSTGPRPDDGLSSWPTESTLSSMLFTDDIKVIKHGVEACFGKDTFIHHLLNHEGPALSYLLINANNLFTELQRTKPIVNRRELAYRRHYVNPKTPRMCERYLSPFYTLLLGPEPAPAIESSPTDRPVPWYDGDSTFLDLADFINERAARMFPGEPEFNSLLVAVTPPGLSASQAPRIYIPALSFFAFTFLGSDGVLKFRRPAGTGSARGRQGQVTLQHGDVVGVQTGPEGLEVIAQQDGFGIFCIGRQIYRLDKEPAEHAIVPHPDASSRSRKQHVPNKPPPRPTKLLHVPLAFWYIGPFPLDPDRPMKVQPNLQIHPSDIPMPIRPPRGDEGQGYNGTEIVSNAETPRLHDPPHIPGEKNGRKRKITDQSESTEGEKVKVKAKPRKSAAKATADTQSVDEASPVKKKGRKSGGAVTKS